MASSTERSQAEDADRDLGGHPSVPVGTPASVRRDKHTGQSELTLALAFTCVLPGPVGRLSPGRTSEQGAREEGPRGAQQSGAEPGFPAARLSDALSVLLRGPLLGHIRMDHVTVHPSQKPGMGNTHPCPWSRAPIHLPGVHPWSCSDAVSSGKLSPSRTGCGLYGGPLKTDHEGLLLLAWLSHLRAVHTAGAWRRHVNEDVSEWGGAGLCVDR